MLGMVQSGLHDRGKSQLTAGAELIDKELMKR
jgi:hypothetical protein